jgi:dUTP pyrophosphatase
LKKNQINKDMNDINNVNDIDKLRNLDPKEFLTDDEKNQMSEIFNSVGMDDWVYDSSDNSMRLKIKVINNSNNPEPKYQKEGDSGFDFMANLLEDEEIVIEPLKRAVVPTGLHFQIPIGFELQVRPRSGLALKNGITVLNTPGTVDSGYRGEVKIVLFNTGEDAFKIKNGDRIAQGVIAPVQIKRTTKIITVNQLDDSDRGTGGFGSTGV